MFFCFYLPLSLIQDNGIVTLRLFCKCCSVLAIVHALPSHPASADNQCVSAHVATSLARKVDSGAFEIITLSPPSSRNPGADGLLPLLIRKQRLIHVRSNVARSNTVDSDTLARPLIRKSLGHLRDGTLGGSIGRNKHAALEREQRSEVDDAPTTTRSLRNRQFEHMRTDIATECEDRVEVHLDDLVEVRVGELVGRVTTLDAGTGDEDGDLVAIGE